MRKTMITAHSGCEGTPDNSVESILKGIELGAECVEVDIRMDEKGTLWLTHDTSVDYASAVSLEKAFSVIAKSAVCVNCDLKEERTLYPVLEMADRYEIPKERLLFSGSVDVKILESDPLPAQRGRIFLNSEELYRHMMGEWGSREKHTEFICGNLEMIAEFFKKNGIEALNAPYTFFSKEQIAAIRNAGIELSLWTVNEEADQKELLQEDLLNMTTRKVESAMHLQKLLNAEC